MEQAVAAARLTVDTLQTMPPKAGSAIRQPRVAMSHAFRV
jgi:hypothetical protein